MFYKGPKKAIPHVELENTLTSACFSLWQGYMLILHAGFCAIKLFYGTFISATLRSRGIKGHEGGGLRGINLLGDSNHVYEMSGEYLE